MRGVAPDERAVRWDKDGRTLYVFRTDRFPLQIVGVDSLTGRRTAWREIAPPDPGTLRGVARVLMTADGEGYAYSYNRMPNDLYLIEGLK